MLRLSHPVSDIYMTVYLPQSEVTAGDVVAPYLQSVGTPPRSPYSGLVCPTSYTEETARLMYVQLKDHRVETANMPYKE